MNKLLLAALVLTAGCATLADWHDTTPLARNEQARLLDGQECAAIARLHSEERYEWVDHSGPVTQLAMGPEIGHNAGEDFKACMAYKGWARN